MADKLRVNEEVILSAIAGLRKVSRDALAAAQSLSYVDMSNGVDTCNVNVGYQLHSVRYSASANQVRPAVQALCRDLKAVSAHMDTLAIRLNDVLMNFTETEHFLAGDSAILAVLDRMVQTFRDWISRINEQITRIVQQIMEENRNKPNQEARSAKVFDTKGQFGGNQKGPLNDYQKRKEEYLDIIEANTGRRLTDAELKAYMKRINDEGCGYVALCNTIFCAYQGRPEDFKRDFGFDMYRDGDLDYNRLLVDIHSSTDGRDAKGKLNEYDDYNKDEDGPKSSYNRWLDDTGRGTTPQDRINHVEQYLKAHGVEVDAKHSDSKLTASDYNKMVENGEVSQGQVHIRLGGKNWHLYDANGNVVSTYSGGHAMTVTGTKGDMLEVSSWGKTYYVKPSDVPKGGYLEYSTVKVGESRNG